MRLGIKQVEDDWMIIIRLKRIIFYEVDKEIERTMEYKVEKFQLSPSLTIPTLEDGATWSSYKLNKPTNMSNKTTSQLEVLKKSSKPQNDDKVSLDLSPDGSQLNITVNGTTLNVTKNSCDITIGNFSISLNSQCCNRTPYPLSVIQPSTVAVVSDLLRNPLHIISTGDSLHVTAALSQCKLTIELGIV